MKENLTKIRKLISEADAIVIGAGAGLSTAAGFEYSGKSFIDNFKYMHDAYGYTDMYSAGFHNFKTKEEYWGYWARYIYLNRYETGALPLYEKLYQLVRDKNYFVLTTNVDHQFQKAGFDKNRLFYTQGDYGLFQCSKHCHNKTYDNEEQIKNMVKNIVNHRIPISLIPKCPICGAPIVPNLRADDLFVEDEGWHKASENYVKFLNDNKNKKILFLELGVGWNTPVIIKYPFIRMTYQFPNANYVCIKKGYNQVPKEIKDKSIVLDIDINNIFP